MNSELFVYAIIKRYGHVLTLKYMHEPYLYANRRVACTRDYQISIMVEPITF